MSKDSEYKVTVLGGDRYPSLEAVQTALLEPLTEALTRVIRERLARGELDVVDGKVVRHGRKDGV